MRLISVVIFYFTCNILFAQQPGANEIKVPDWVHNKPIGSSKYVGIGVSEKK